LHLERADLLRQYHEWRDRPVISIIGKRKIDHVAISGSSQGIQNLLSNADGDVVLRFKSRRAEMRSRNHIGKLYQRFRYTENGFRLKDIQPRPSYLPGLQRLKQRAF